MHCDEVDDDEEETAEKQKERIMQVQDGWRQTFL